MKHEIKMSEILEKLNIIQDIVSAFAKKDTITDIKPLKVLLEDHNPYEIYPANGIHGAEHILRVCIFTYIICTVKKISVDEIKTAILASIYHDIGRISGPNYGHGEAGAKIVAKLLGNESMYTVSMVQAIIHGHDIDNTAAKELADIYSISVSKFNNFKKLLYIVKDADAIDLLRFDDTIVDRSLLRNEESKELYDIIVNKFDMLYV